MTTAQARPVLELVGAESPAAGWSDLDCSELGEPLAEAAVLGCLLRTSRQHVAALLAAFADEDLTVPQHRHVAAPARILLEQGHPIDPVTVLGQLRRQGTEDARTASRDAGGAARRAVRGGAQRQQRRPFTCGSSSSTPTAGEPSKPPSGCCRRPRSGP